ncbi:MAG: glycine cleavage system protein GcvH [Nitrospirae bacterium]|nr:glycine cleavage system protein GcvH [Nitrospirota bacterium]
MDPEELKYHKEHIWVKINGKKAIIGITNYAQEFLGKISYIDLPEAEMDVEANTELAEIEASKSSFFVVNPLSGTVTAVNEELSETPEIMNEDPYGKGWIAVVKMRSTSELNDLMDASEYERYLEKEIKLK